MTASSSPRAAHSVSFRFDQVRVFPIERRLTVAGREVAVGARAFDVLLALIERRERLVPRDELLEIVWADAVIEPNNLAVQISALRKVIGPAPITTIPGRGYRFSAMVDEVATVAAVHAVPLPVRAAPYDPPDALIGRAIEQRELAGLSDAHRVVTIAGPGGIGKTCLAYWFVQERRDAYAQGVCWIELAAVVDPRLLPAALAAGLGIPLVAGDPLVALGNALAPLEVLIGLDNAEHLLADTTLLVEALLAAAPRLRFVVTSQAPLRLPQERVLRLAALAIPPRDAPFAAARDYGAIELFVRRAQAADARFTLNPSNASAIVHLCERLDGLPLAIEFAAARAPLLGVERIIESLEHRFRLLKGGSPSAPARQQTMHATLAWSHQLLGRNEQIVFRRMAVFAGSASLESVQAVVADPDGTTGDADGPLDRWSVVDVLATLIDRSLVTILPDPRDADSPRYRLLESPRAFAAERLATAGESALLEARHGHAMAAAMQGVWIDRWSGRVAFGAWIDAVEAERDNLRVALAWALRHRNFEVVMPIASVLLTRTLPGCDSNEMNALAEVLDRWLADRPIASCQLPVRLQLMMFWNHSDIRRSLREADCALPLAEAEDDCFAAYLIASWRVRLCVLGRDMAGAAAAVARVEVLEDVGWPAIRLWVGAEARGVYEYIEGTPASLLEAAHREHRMSRLAGATGYVGASHLINAQLAAGQFAEAAASGWALLEDMRGSRNTFGSLIVRVNLAAALIELGDVERARPIIEATWPTGRHFAVGGECADYLALVAALDARWETAATLIGHADALYADRGAQRWPNERKVHDRALDLARSAIGALELVRLVDAGGRLTDVEIDALVVGGR